MSFLVFILAPPLSSSSLETSPLSLPVSYILSSYFLSVTRFNADTGAGMRWHFRPQQREITVSFINITTVFSTFTFKLSKYVL